MAVSSADKKKLGKWIKQAREKKQPHLSQRQLALAVDITNASLSSIESGMIFPSEELLLKLIEQLQPPPELREKMLALFAKAKGTSPPDINAELSKNPKLWGLIRQLTNDILISVVGTLGNACIIQEHEVPAIFSCKSTAVKAKHINPFYLLSYLNSKYGRSLLLRKERGAIQKGLNLDDLKSLDIPLFSDSLYKSAELCIKKSLDFIQRAKQCYADAEKRLEATIIPTLSLSCSNTSIKSLKESFLHSGRLDAEYYQEKYQAYLFRTPAPLYKEKSFYPRTQYIKYLLNQAGMFLLADGKEVWHQLYLMRI